MSVTELAGPDPVTTVWVPVGPAPGDATYVHTQAAISAAWNGVHKLNKRPSVTVVDSGDSVIISDVHYVDNNTVTLTFGNATSGKAYCN